MSCCQEGLDASAAVSESVHTSAVIMQELPWLACT